MPKFTDILKAARPGDVITLPRGVYRDTLHVPCDRLTVIAPAGVEVRGTDTWTGWEKRGAYWYSRQALPELRDWMWGRPEGFEVAAPGASEFFDQPERVVANDYVLKRVASDPARAEYALTDDRRIVLGVRPSDFTIEVAIRPRWIEGHGYSDFRIVGGQFRHAATPAQGGTIWNDGGDRWRIENVRASEGSAAAVSLTGGKQHQISGCTFGGNGQLGLHVANVAGLTVERSLLAGNNQLAPRFSPYWEAGGVKVSASTGILFRDCAAEYNHGPGIWFDNRCKGVSVIRCRVEGNTHNGGVHIEVSDDWLVSGCYIARNGLGVSVDDGEWNPGLLVTVSSPGVADGNILVDNHRAVSILDRDRDEPDVAMPHSISVRDTRVVQHGDYDPVGWHQWREGAPSIAPPMHGNTEIGTRLVTGPEAAALRKGMPQSWGAIP